MAEQVRVVITAQDKTKDGVNSVEKNLQNLENKASDIGSKAAVAFAGLAAAIGGSVKMSMDFEASMDRVAAISQATRSQFEALQETATQMGAETVYSATQAADALSYLAMAGFSVEQQVDAIPGVLSMAAAGMVDLASAADIGSGILAGFNLEASEMNRVADILTAGFMSTNTELVDLGEAMKFMAPVAAALGISIEETTAAVGLLGNAGIKGGNAGRQLRSALNDLLKPSQEAAGLMQQLGISAVDNTGQFKSFADIVQNVKEATEGMTDAQRAQTVATLMGSEGATAFLAIMQAGPDTLRELTTELENSGGTAERIATQQLDNLKGTLEELKSQFEDTAIAAGDAFSPAAEALGELLKELLGNLSSLIRGNEDAVRSLGIFALAFAGTTAAVSALTVAISAMWTAMGPIGWAIIGVSALAAAVGTLAISAKAAEIEQRKQGESLIKLNGEYERLNKVVGDSKTSTEEKTKAQEDLKGTIEEIGNLMPELVSKWDAEGRAIELNTEKLRDNTKAAKENKQAKAQQDLDELKEAATGAFGNLVATRETIDRAKESVRRTLARELEAGVLTQEQYDTALEANYGKIESAMAGKLQEAIQEYDRAIGRVNQKRSELYGPQSQLYAYDQPYSEPATSGGGNGGSGSGSGSGIGSGSKDPYRDALKYVDYLKSTGQITAQEEIARLEEVQRIYAKSAEERMDIETRIYQAKDKLSKDSASLAETERKAKLNAAVGTLDHQLRMNQIGAAEEIQRLRDILATHELTNDERMALEERLASTQARYANEAAGKIVKGLEEARQADEDRVRNYLANLNHQQRIGELSKEKEVAALQAHLKTEESYYRHHADERWAIEERIYGLTEDLRDTAAQAEKKRQQDINDARQKVMDTIGKAEKTALESLKARHKGEQEALQRSIDMAEERLRQYDKEIARVDRLQKLQDAQRKVDELRTQQSAGMGDGEWVLTATGQEWRVRGLAEAEKELEKVKTENQRAEERERLQSQVETLRTQLANLQTSHEQELAAHTSYWETVKTVADNGLQMVQDAQVEQMGNLAEQLGTQLGGLLGQWSSYANDVRTILSSIPGIPAPTKTVTGHDKANPKYAYATGAYLPGNRPHLAMVGEVEETIVPHRYLPNLAADLLSNMAAMMPRLPAPMMPALGGMGGGIGTINIPVTVKGPVDNPAQVGREIGQSAAQIVQSVMSRYYRGQASGKTSG